MIRTNIILTALLAVAGGFLVYVSLAQKENLMNPSGKTNSAATAVGNAQSFDIWNPQESSEGGVWVVVRPSELSPESSFWDFEVILDTHSIELDDDMTKISELTDDTGGRYRALAWDGDPPGGHHRKGVLEFASVTPRPASITLVIRGVGGVDERKFTWILR